MSLTAVRPSHFPYFPYDGFTFCLAVTDPEDRAFLSGMSAAEFEGEAGKMVVRGDMSEQAPKMYEKLGVVLEAAGLSWADAVHLTENVSVAGIASYDIAEATRAAVLGEANPAVTTVVVDRLVRRQALIELEVVAVRSGGRAHTGPDGSCLAIETASEVTLSTIHPVDAAGAVVAQGDYAGQLRYCLQRAGLILGGLGMSLADVVRTVDYSPLAGGYSASRAIRAEMLGAPYPAAACITTGRLWREDILISLDVVASRAPRVSIGSDWAGEPVSQAIQVGHDLFVSGLATLDMVGGPDRTGQSMEEQAVALYSDIVALVEVAGGRAEDIAQTIEYVRADMLGDYRVVADVRERLLRPPWPASVGAVCSGFARAGTVIDAVARAVLPG